MQRTHNSLSLGSNPSGPTRIYKGMNMINQLLEFLNPKVVRNTANDKLIVDYPKIIKPKHELYKDKSSEWRWRITASNGDIIAASCEGYKNKVDAEKNLRYITNLRIGQ